MNSPFCRRSFVHTNARAIEFFRIAACWALACQIATVPFTPAFAAENNNSNATREKAAAKPVTDVVMKTMQAELARATTDLGKEDSPPYYLSYTVYDQNAVVLVGSYGSLLTDASLQRRQADVVMRVGSAALDNTHGQSRPTGMTSGTLPLGDDQDAISRVLWELSDREYKRAAPAFLNVRTNAAVRAEEEDKSPDFSKEAPEIHVVNEGRAPAFDRAAWESEVRRLSANFRKYPEVYFATVVLQVTNSDSRMVSSEGSAIETPSATTRLIMEAQTRADDGMELLRVETFQAPSASGLPAESDLAARISKMADDLKALKNAPVARSEEHTSELQSHVNLV